MQHSEEHTAARQRVLDAAERLFAKKGYTAVTLRDIAAEIGIRHTSLYHHVPGGKEQLFIEVTERNLQRHYDGLTQAITNAEPHVRAQLRAVADWLLSEPPMDLIRMNYSDMPAIDPSHADRLSHQAYAAMLAPIEVALQHAQQRGEIEYHDLGLIAGSVLGLIESLYAIPQSALDQHVHSRQEMAYELIDVLLNGLRKR
ncbi:MAG: TetR/AcrR family transcriptional regulator [Chloroflexales bacterium]|nr:TetR/AcrR family transcriptional regulator [Chloroflexales bacterium]